MINFLFLFLFLAKGAYFSIEDPYPYTIQENVYQGSYKTYYVNVTGTENIRCATPRSGCHTLADTLRRVLGTRSTGSGRNSEAQIHFTNGTYEPESDSITITRPITITGSNIYNPIVSYENPYFDPVVLKVAPTSKPLITIGDGNDLFKVQIQYMTFSIDSAQKLSQPIFTVSKSCELDIEYVQFNSTYTDSTLSAHSKSIIDASEGYLKISQASFSNITLATDPLLLISQDHFFYKYGDAPLSSVSSTTFVNITRNTGDGAVFEINVELKKDEDIRYIKSLESLYFFNCSVSSNNNGGALYVRINTDQPNFSPSFKDLHFYGEGIASAGSYIYLASNNSNVAKKENYEYFFKPDGGAYDTDLETKTEGRPNEFVLQEDKKDKIDVYYEDRTIIIGGDNAVADECSTDAKPCTTFLAASKSANFSKAPVIWLAGHTIESSGEGVTFGTIGRVIRPRLNTYPASIVLLESFTGTVFTVSSGVTMSCIDFKIKKPGDGKFAPVVFSAAADLSLYHVTFSPENDDDSISMQDSLISVAANGRLTLEECSVSALEFAKVVINDASPVSTSSPNIKTCSFTYLKLTECLLKTVQSKTSFAVTDSKFQDIELKDQSLFDCAYTDEPISSCNFVNITKESGNGSIWSGDISIKNVKFYDIWSTCTFDNCTVKAGNGGAFYFNLLTTGTEVLTLQLTGGKFIKCTAAEDSSKASSTGFGGAIFVECSGLSTVTYSDNVQYSGEMNGKGKWLALHINTKEGIIFHNFSSIFQVIDDDDIVRVLGEDWEPIHLYPPEILINSTLLKTTGSKCLNATEDEKEAGFAYICPTLEVANAFLAGYYTDHFNAHILYHNITYTSAIQELVPQLQTPLTIEHYRFINGSNDARTVLVVPSFHPTLTTYVVSVASDEYPPVTFKDLTFSLNTTKGRDWNPLNLFSVSSSLKLDNVTINTLATTITPFDDFTNVTSSTRTIYSPLDKSLISVSSAGRLDLTNVLFENITLSNVPLLNLPVYQLSSPLYSTNNIKLHETNKFKDITRNEGNGAVLEMQIGNGMYFVLGNFTFENCTAANGNGGAVAFVLDWDASLIFGNPETNKDLPEFKHCVAAISNEQSADEVAGYGGAVYLRLKGEPLPNGLRLNKIKTSGGSAKSGRVLFAYGKYANLTKGGEYFKSVVSSGGDANDYLIGSYDQPEVPVETKNMANANGRKLWYQLWWVWLLVGLFILILIAVIVIVIVCCCCKKSS